MTIKSLITGALTITLGLSGIAGMDTAKKLLDCTGKDIQYESGDNYYCAVNTDYLNDWTREYTKVKDGKSTVNDLTFLSLVAHNDEFKRMDLKKHFESMYDDKKKEFNAGEDFMPQMMLLAELANVECKGSCEIDPKNLDEEIYNLIK